MNTQQELREQTATSSPGRSPCLLNGTIHKRTHQICGADLFRVVTTLVLIAAAIAMAPTANAASEYRPPAKVPPVGIGFRGDGGGYFPDAKIPVEFGDEKNLLWKTPLVNWSHSSPVPVGNRVLMMAEPTWSGATWPQLTCFDADTGELLWVADVNPLDAFPDMPTETREAITADFKWYYGWHNTIHTLCRPIARAGGAKEGDPRLAKLNSKLADLDVAVKAICGGDSGYLGRGHSALDMKEGMKSRLDAMRRRIRPYHLFDSWVELGVTGRSGVTLATPVSDGKHIWVFTSHVTVACFDMDGKRQWITSLRRMTKQKSIGGPYTYLASPVLYGDLVLAYAAGTSRGNDNFLAAIDRETGEARWTANPHVAVPQSVMDTWKSGGKKIRFGRTGRPLQIIDLQGTPVLLTAAGGVFRLPDGKKFEVGIPNGLPTLAVDDEHDVIYGAANGGFGRWSLALKIIDGELALEPRWFHQDKGTGSSLVYGGGRVFLSGFQVDPATGLRLGGTENAKGRYQYPQTAPENRHTLLATRTHVYGCTSSKGPKRGVAPADYTPLGTIQVFTHAGKKVAENTLTRGELSPEHEARMIEQGRNLNLWAYACSMNIGGDRLYVASQDFLYCIGEK